MTRLRLRLAPTEAQPLAVMSALDDGTVPANPVVVMLHGTLRHSGVLATWVARLKEQAEVLLVDLPGHGRSLPVIPATAEAFAARVLGALRLLVPDRPVIVVGESLGGLVALAMAASADPGPVRAVAAFDPPMATAKLWHVQSNVRRLLEKQPDDAALRSLAEEIFGIDPHGGLTDRIFYPLLDQLRVPALVATGDLALFPPRQMAGVACLFDAVDQYVARRFYPDIEIEVVPGAGHLLLVEHPEPCERMIHRLIQKHAGDA